MNESHCVTFGRPTADLRIDMSDSPDPVARGSLLTYTLTATTNGPSTASKVKVLDRLPVGVSPVLVSTTPGTRDVWTTGSDAPHVNCRLGWLSAKQSATITVRVTPTMAGKLINQAAVKSYTVYDPDLGDHTAAETTTVLAAGQVGTAAQTLPRSAATALLDDPFLGPDSDTTAR